jgi:hypothetical protein
VFGAGFPHLSGSILGGRQGDPKDAVLLGSKADKKALRQVLQRFSKDWGVRNIWSCIANSNNNNKNENNNEHHKNNNNKYSNSMLLSLS